MVASVTAVEDALPFLQAYPFPAWICATINGQRSSEGFVVEPTWSNAAFGRLFGSHSTFLTAMGNVEAFVSFGTWLESTEDVPTTHSLALKLRWEHEEWPEETKEETIVLELAKTKVVDANSQPFAIVTSTSKQPLPSIPDYLAQAKKQSRKKKRVPPGKLVDLPSFRSSLSTQSTSSSSQSNSLPAIDKWILGARAGPKMEELIEMFPWETTPLGPKENWDPCLRQASQLVLKSPFPAAIWWGQDLVLIYNDAYAEMSTTKHPRIFGQKGIEAWGEIWDSLGPAMGVCIKGNPVSKRDGENAT
jgi:hypothetical protein